MAETKINDQNQAAVTQAILKFKLSSIESEAPFAFKYLIEECIGSSQGLTQFQKDASKALLRQYNIIKENGKIERHVREAVSHLFSAI